MKTNTVPKLDITHFLTKFNYQQLKRFINQLSVFSKLISHHLNSYFWTNFLLMSPFRHPNSTILETDSEDEVKELRITFPHLDSRPLWIGVTKQRDLNGRYEKEVRN